MKTRKNIKTIFLSSPRDRFMLQSKSRTKFKSRAKSKAHTKFKSRTKFKARTKSKSRAKSKSQTRRALAGQAFAEGGFGCVFRPQLACNKPTKVHAEGVSKLMKRQHQKNELKELATVKKIVTKIKNYSDYFLVDDIYGCVPAPLSDNDKEHFNENCKNLVKKGIKKNNVNKKLKSLGIINIPYGGISIDKYFSTWNMLSNSLQKRKSFIATNKSLLLLLKNGILPLQQNKYLHMDIKGSNILRNVEDDNEILGIDNIKTRLIDWGLAVDFSSTPKGKVPYEIFNGPIQYNTPFSTILFQENMNMYIKKFLSQYSNLDKRLNSNDRMQIMKYLASYIYNISLDVVGEGHNNYILALLHEINARHTKNEEPSVTVFSHEEIIVEYLAIILNKYLDHKYHFLHGKYFHEVYSKNVDIWGFIMAYIDLANLKKSYAMRSDLSIAVAKIIHEYCFSTTYAIKPIPIQKLVTDLKKLNQLA